MSRHIEATFQIGSWDETPFEDGDDSTRLTEALVNKRYEGDIKGTSTTKWLLAYAPDRSALFVGIEHITGAIGGHTGGLVLLHDGSYRDGVASADVRIASGTGELADAAGGGKFRADPAGSITLDLDGLDTAIADSSRSSRR
ncbi:DUF3224 domain-containing protein [Mycobacterium sp. IDR2000157661]|uniref:DUF3224 domain-containing protein n=1 Tax=Mycobacterium sp. IDR2000157661 TaxID=2867005 RepID=UPI001EED4ECB|nr:DUF3224 domain-containing protein [Mycobacterium sp. IDR2000157661]ULE34842.1 DUF3224 domain-containing protein [Mycobacterium sp. IDR2000157661]